jgi:hypothetical protein
VACNQKIPTETGSSRADTLAARAPDPAWKRRSCGDGVKGPRLYDWAVASLPDTGTAEHGHGRWLLIRRSITDPTELAYYLCYGPDDTTDDDSSVSPAPDGRSRSVSRPRRTRSASTTIRSVATTPGTAISPWRCGPTRSSPSPPQRQKGQRPRAGQTHPTHPRRGPTSAGTLDHHDPPPRSYLAVVQVAAPASIPRPNQPLPAQTPNLKVRLEY